MRFVITIFLGAFLLFEVQPVFAKAILPWFGGSPATWTTCMLFFQLFLLLGYAYAHLTSRWLAPRAQALAHLVLLAGSVALLPITPSAAWKPAGDVWPVPRILGVLVVSIGLPYFMLSTTAPLMQAWFSRSRPGESPYRLYAVSNLASLLALVGYPFAVEPAVPLRVQMTAWSALYVLFAVGSGICAWRASGSHVGSRDTGPEAPGPAPGIGRWIGWLLLPAIGSMLLLATTNQLCQDVAVVPFLWILPLALYLLSFILCFESDRWYRRAVWGPAFAVAAAAACWILYRGIDASLAVRIAVYGAVLFVSCMVCHGELARRRPRPAHLTGYYLAIATGGAAGGAFVSLAAPVLFPGFWEFHLGIAACAVVVLWTAYSDWSASAAATRAGRRRVLAFVGWAGALAGLWGLLVALVIHARADREGTLEIARDFYGVLRVKEIDRPGLENWRYELTHGATVHGTQFRDPERRDLPTTYYGPDSGIGLALRLHPRRLGPDPSLSIGVVGLGAGTLASYGGAGDRMRFYEIDPEVVRISQRWFTYRADSAAAIEIVTGDARLSLERELAEGRPGRFDVLAVDAFSGDAIPVHLLTRECFAIYRRHLARGGILAFHISNHYLDLEPVVVALAREAGDEALRIDGKTDRRAGLDASTWILVTTNQEFITDEEVASRVVPRAPGFRPLSWTDDYSDLFRVLR